MVTLEILRIRHYLIRKQVCQAMYNRYNKKNIKFKYKIRNFKFMVVG